mmetsp:Transcript_28620/g.72387  ORF Transcript_28620/g.72387 Transcript_28620/m.72387 type:complete len:242 (+) Transcript_28620:314-1039(+)
MRGVAHLRRDDQDPPGGGQRGVRAHGAQRGADRGAPGRRREPRREVPPELRGDPRGPAQRPGADGAERLPRLPGHGRLLRPRRRGPARVQGVGDGAEQGGARARAEVHRVPESPRRRLHRDGRAGARQRRVGQRPLRHGDGAEDGDAGEQGPPAHAQGGLRRRRRAALRLPGVRVPQGAGRVDQLHRPGDPQASARRARARRVHRRQGHGRVRAGFARRETALPEDVAFLGSGPESLYYYE